MAVIHEEHVGKQSLEEDIQINVVNGLKSDKFLADSSSKKLQIQLFHFG